MTTTKQENHYIKGNHIMFALWISVLLNGEMHESIPAVFYSYEDCLAATVQYKDIAQDMECFKAKPELLIKR